MSSDEPDRTKVGGHSWFSELDSLLRGELTRVSSLSVAGS